MIRLLFTIIAGVLLGGVVHLVSVLALPRIASQDAYSRLTPITKLNAVTRVAAGRSRQYADALHRSGVRDRCLPLRSVGRADKARGPVSQAYTSVSFYTRSDVAYYAINDRSAGKQSDRTQSDDRGPARRSA